MTDEVKDTRPDWHHGGFVLAQKVHDARQPDESKRISESETETGKTVTVDDQTEVPIEETPPALQ